MTFGENNSLKNIALGLFEIAVFIGKGVERFPKDVNTAKTSFTVCAFLAFVSALIFYIAPTERIGERSLLELSALYVSIAALSLFVFYVLIYGLVRHLEKDENFWRFVTINNSIGLVSATISLPLALMVYAGIHEWEDIYNMLIVILFYGIGVQGFIATYALKVPWQLGAAIALLSMFVHQSASKTVFYLWGLA